MSCCCNDVERIGFTEPMSIALRANTHATCSLSHTHAHTHTHTHTQGEGGGNLHVITAYSWLILLALPNRPEWQLEILRTCFNITHTCGDTHTQTHMQTHTYTHTRTHTPQSYSVTLLSLSVHTVIITTLMTLNRNSLFICWFDNVSFVLHNYCIVWNNMVNPMAPFVTCIISTWCAHERTQGHTFNDLRVFAFWLVAGPNVFVFISPKEAKKRNEIEIPPAVSKPVSSLNSAGKRTLCTFNHAHFPLLCFNICQLYINLMCFCVFK